MDVVDLKLAETSGIERGDRVEMCHELLSITLLNLDQ